MATTGRTLLELDNVNLDNTLAELESQLKHSSQEIAKLRKDNQRLQDLLDAPRLREQKRKLEKQNQQLEERLDQVLEELKKTKLEGAAFSRADKPPQGTVLAPIEFQASPLGITIWKDENTMKNAKIIDFRRDEPRRKGLAKGDYLYKVNESLVWGKDHNDILEEIHQALQTPPISLTFFRPTHDFTHDAMADRDFQANLASIASYRAAEEWGSNIDDNKPPNQQLLRYRGKLLLEMVWLLVEEDDGAYSAMSPLVNAYVSSWGASYGTISDLSRYHPTGTMQHVRTMLNTVPINESERQTFGLLTIYDAIRLLSVDVSNAHLDESNERNRGIFAELAASLGCTPEQLANMYDLVNREKELARKRSDLLGVSELSEILSPGGSMQNGVDDAENENEDDVF